MTDEYICPFEQYQLVKFIKTSDFKYPFDNNEVVLFLGEIKNMEGHCIVVKKNGKVLWGYHTDNFEALTEDEI